FTLALQLFKKDADGDIAQMRAEFERRLDQKGVQKILDKLASIAPSTPLAGCRADRPVRTPVAVVPRKSGAPASGDLAPGERRILTAVAQFGEVDRGQLTVLVGYKATARDTYISRLAQKGFVQSGN